MLMNGDVWLGTLQNILGLQLCRSVLWIYVRLSTRRQSPHTFVTSFFSIGLLLFSDLLHEVLIQKTHESNGARVLIKNVSKMDKIVIFESKTNTFEIFSESV